MEALSKLLNPIIGSTTVGAFHLSSNSHRNGDCPCKLMTSSTSIWTAAETNDYDTVCARIAQNSALISKLDAYGYSGLHYAAQHNHIKIVEYFLSKGCPPDSNSCGATALHRAAYSGSFESCELLLKAGADVNAVDSSYRDMGSPLHKAYSVASVPIVTLLLACGANPLQLDASGKTPQELLKKKYLHKFELLAENHMKVEQKTEALESTDAVNITGVTHSNGEGNSDIDRVVQQESKVNADEPVLDITAIMAPTSLLELSSTPFISASTISSNQLVDKKIKKWESIGLQCSRCGFNCLSFTRLADGSLICTDCKYKDPQSTS